MLGLTTPGRVRTGRTIADYSPSAWTFGTSQGDIMRHHSCGPPPSSPMPGRPPQSPAVLTHPWPSSIVPGRPHISPAVHPPCPALTCLTLQGPPSYPKMAVLHLGRTGRTTASRPVPSGALGRGPTGPPDGCEH